MCACVLASIRACVCAGRPKRLRGAARAFGIGSGVVGVVPGRTGAVARWEDQARVLCIVVARSRPLVRVGCAGYLGQTVTYRFVRYLGSIVELCVHLGCSGTLKQVSCHVVYTVLRVNIAPNHRTSSIHTVVRVYMYG